MTAALRQASIFAELDDGVFATLAGNARVLTWNKGETLFHQGDPATAFFVVRDGWVTLLRDTSDGVRTLIKLIGPGESFAEALIGAGARYPVTAEAATPLSAARFDCARFRTLLTDNPDLALSIVAATFRQMQRLIDQIEGLKSWSVERRVADMMLQMYQSLGAPGGGFILPVEQTLIAARLSITPSTLSRTLRKLAPLGVAADRGRIVLRDPARLAAFVEDGRL